MTITDCNDVYLEGCEKSHLQEEVNVLKLAPFQIGFGLKILLKTVPFIIPKMVATTSIVSSSGQVQHYLFLFHQLDAGDRCATVFSETENDCLEHFDSIHIKYPVMHILQASPTSLSFCVSLI